MEREEERRRFCSHLSLPPPPPPFPPYVKVDCKASPPQSGVSLWLFRRGREVDNWGTLYIVYHILASSSVAFESKREESRNRQSKLIQKGCCCCHRFSSPFSLGRSPLKINYLSRGQEVTHFFSSDTDSATMKCALHSSNMGDHE